MIDLDSSKVNSHVMPNFNKSMKFLKDAYNISLNLKSNSMNSVTSQGRTNEIASEINFIKNEVNNIKKSVSENVLKAESIEKKYKNNNQTKENVSIYPRGFVGPLPLGARYEDDCGEMYEDDFVGPRLPDTYIEIDEQIKQIEESLELCNVTLEQLQLELNNSNSYQQFIEDITSDGPSVVNYFPECLYDLNVLNSISNDEYCVILDALLYLGIETNPNLTYDEYKKNVEEQKYLEYMYNYSGSSVNYVNIENIITILPSLFDYYSFPEYQLDKKLKRDSILTDEQFDGPYYELIDYVHSLGYRTYANIESEKEKLFSSDAIAYAIYLGYTEEELKIELNKAIENGSVHMLEQKILSEGKSKILSEYIDMESVNTELTEAFMKYSNGEMTTEVYQKLVISIVEQAFLEKNPEYKGYGQSQFGLFKNSTTADTMFRNIRGLTQEDINSDFNLILHSKMDKEQEQLQKDINNYKTIIENLEKMKKDLELDKLISEFDYSKYSGKPSGLSSSYDEYIDVMTEEEMGKFYYLYNKYGEDKAEEYFEIKEEEWNSSIGLIRAYNWINEHLTVDGQIKPFDSMTPQELAELEDLGLDSSFFNALEVAAKGGTEGVETFFEGIGNIFCGDGVTSADEYERMYLQMMLSTNFLLGHTYNISSSMGNMLPSIAVSTVITIATKNPSLGAKIGAVLMGVSSAGNTYEGALQEGYNYWQAAIYGALSGTSEAALGYFLGGIPGLSKLDNVPGIKGIFTKAISEGFEESTQSIIDPLIKSVICGEKLEINWEEVMQSGIYGMITAGIMNGGVMVVNGVKISLNGISAAHMNVLMEAQDLGYQLDYNRITDPNYIADLQEAINYRKSGAEISIENITRGMHSYNNLDDICKDKGITIDEFVTLSRTPESELSDSQLKIVYDIRIKMTESVAPNGTVIAGTRMCKAQGLMAFDQWTVSKDGEPQKISGCAALADDFNVLKTPTEIVNVEGLLYSPTGDGTLTGNPYVYADGKSITEVINSDGNLDTKPFITTEFDAPADGFTIRVSPTSSGEVDRLVGITGISSERYDLSGAATVYEGNPNTGTGITLNQGDDSLGIPEFYGGLQDVSNAKNYLWLNGEKIYIGEKDANGVFVWASEEAKRAYEYALTLV